MEIYSKEDRDKIIDSLNNDRIVIMPTDTVYGIMARASRDNEIRINKLKNRDKDKKISVIFPDKDSLDSYLYDISRYKKEYMDNRLPGKYTFIVKLNKFSDFEREDFGVRITSNSFLQGIIKKTGPLLASSCNVNKKSPCENITEIKEVFGNLDIDLVEVEENLDKASIIISLLEDIEIIRE